MTRFALALCVLSTACGGAVCGDRGAEIEALLLGQLKDGEAKLAEMHKAEPADQQVRLGLGVAKFCRAVEHAGQSMYKYGLYNKAAREIGLPILRMPVPENPNPAAVSPADLRKVFENWVADLKAAEETLAGVDDGAVKLPIHLARIRLNLRDDALPSNESLWELFTTYRGGRGDASGFDPQKFLVKFDRTDAIWLRGYCNLLSAIADVVLAYDGKEAFDHCAHLVFPRPNTSFAFLKHGGWGGTTDQIIDGIAFIHLFRFPVKEPERMKSALGHLEQVVKLSREMWKSALAETDDDFEWIPNPRQKGMLPNLRVTQEMIDGWMGFLDEAQAILEGKKLIPFWRDASLGVNLRKVFLEPRTLDLVLWVQGTAAAPYLEKGEQSQAGTWDRFQRVFRGEFLLFALWWN